ncbi:MAG: hypothetical protein LBN95_12240 [Prevotellaceae bacterium]|jgi:hypothetical protein|nr:hypothetical protein [Prevotellaceae bacterium]
MAALLECPTLENIQNMSINEQLEMCGVRFSTNGEPILKSHNEVFTDFAQKLVNFYGETIKQPLNKSLSNHQLQTI